MQESTLREQGAREELLKWQPVRRPNVREDFCGNFLARTAQRRIYRPPDDKQLLEKARNCGLIGGLRGETHNRLKAAVSFLREG
jgi:hypothetical protein